MPSQFLLEQNSIPVPRQLAATIGLEEATVFQQLWYSLQNPQMGGTVRNGQKWIRNPIECRDAEKQQRAEDHGKAIDWLSNFPFLSPYKIRRIFAKLEQLGLVISTKLRATKWDQCKYYSINQDKLTELLKSLSLPICHFLTNRFVETEHIDLSSVRKSYQDTISTVVIQNLEREPGAENKNWEEEKEASEGLTLRFDKEQEFGTRARVTRSDKSSVAVASGCDAVHGNCLPLIKGETVESVAQHEIGSDELRKFQTQLEDLGKRLGRKSPVAWAFTIVKNLNTDKPCTYWEEFKAGIPLGTSEQREWEITPGVACSIAVQCLEQDYLARPGTTPQEAARKAAQTIARPKEMAAVWESIKAQVMFRRSEWEKQSALGVQSPVIDSWMVPKQSASVEEVAIALQEIQPTSVAALPATAPATVPPNQELLSAAVLVESMEVTERAIKQSEQSEQSGEETAGIIAEAKAKISAALGKFARPGKKRAILEANMAEVGDSEYVAPVTKVSNTGGGLADYLRQIELAEEEVW